MHPYSIVLALLLTLGVEILFAQSTNKIAESSATISTIPKLKLITADRLTLLSVPERAEWVKYLALSETRLVNERRLLAKEIAEAGLSASRPAPSNSKEFELGSKIDTAQIVIHGKPTVWCAQHDPLTLAPAAARLKEPPSLSGGESAELVKFLMREAPETPSTRKAIEFAVAWFAEHKLTGLRTTKNANGKTDYIADPTSTEVLWARFYDLKTQHPIFAGADDGIIYASYSEMAQKNKVAYNYFTTRPRDLITKEVERWKKRVGK